MDYRLGPDSEIINDWNLTQGYWQRCHIAAMQARWREADRQDVERLLSFISHGFACNIAIPVYIPLGRPGGTVRPPATPPAWLTFTFELSPTPEKGIAFVAVLC